MRGVHAIRAAVLLVALGMLAALALAWAPPIQDQDPPERPAAGQEQEEDQDEADQPGRRRTARLVLPWTELDDLTPRQEAAIREIRTEILKQREELDRIERERILEVLTEAQKERVQEIEAQRQARQEEQRQRQRERDRERRNTTRPSGEDDEQE